VAHSEFNQVFFANLEKALQHLASQGNEPGKATTPSNAIDALKRYAIPSWAMLQRAKAEPGMRQLGRRACVAAATRTFYGKLTAVLQCEESDRTRVESRATEEFKEIVCVTCVHTRPVVYSAYASKCGQRVGWTHHDQIVDVDGSTNLLDALEKYAGPHTIHDFRTPRGHVTTAQREVWLTSLPEILSVHLQRVRYSTTVRAATPLQLRLMMPMRLTDVATTHPMCRRPRRPIGRRRSIASLSFRCPSTWTATC